MNKVLCETTGDFMLVDTTLDNQVVAADRPSVVKRSDFINQRAMLGQLNFLGDVNDEASDEEFENFYNESDRKMDLAVDSFMSKFGTADGQSKKQIEGPKGDEDGGTGEATAEDSQETMLIKDSEPPLFPADDPLPDANRENNHKRRR